MHLLKKSPWDDLDDSKNTNIFSKKKYDFMNFQFNFNSKFVLFIILAICLLWLTSGIYEIKEGSEAVVTRFGAFNRIAKPGLNYHLPNPIENKFIEKIAQSRRVEIGYRSNNSSKHYGRYQNASNTAFRDIGNESIMLTGDENIIELNVDVMWHISDLKKYIFNVENPNATIKLVAESAIREVIGNTPIASVLSSQKQEITDKIEILIQSTLDQYNIGIKLEQVQLLKAEPPKEVIESYRDVQTSKADKEKEINQAQSYNNDVLPKARGEAAKLLQEADAYKQEIISKAKGDIDRFNSIYTEYLHSKEVTKNRLYLDTVRDILMNNSKVIIENSTLPHMDLNTKLKN
ncbi:FtsH protease activity modulator HflK [Rickettsia endosymbiont of Cardiosporidium cionae]|uniref:FtsH protease activity modulator HflK n=1 Tax=Rickettsia endosymbiont of Cardiosporidium cionae TaxID=2777155 RepID=UPI0018948E7D|nr:FtsH protease activity modulator HflK [Rickettsia endosymbiont of Cardiosporidium cionae]KAF8818645.1 FtsH protease activity modulator HflK [Rickettsia endosymbiont of Cardiosporidium cionae]